MKKRLDSIYEQMVLSEGYIETTDEAEEEIEKFIDFYESEDYPELIVEYSEGVCAMKIASVFDSLVWMTNDNGEYLVETYRNWLESGDKRKIEIVLSTSMVFPYPDMQHFGNLLDDTQTRFPDLKPLCDNWRKAIINHQEDEL